MKLLRARFDGFRLLRDVEIEFSTDEKRNITVIRAANESGKTTMLSALQWGLFGEAALPGSFALAPMDLAAGSLSDTSVEIDYEVEGKKGPTRYRVVRSITTRVDEPISTKSTLQMYNLLPTGADPLSNANAVMAAHIPTELREVFFTDGDRALSFIEGKRSEQQKRIKLAIEQMMGLPRLINAIDHLRKVEKDIRSRLSGESGSEELAKLKQEIDTLDQVIPELEEKLEQSKDEFAKLNDFHNKANRDLEDALKRGNRDEIAAELQAISKNMQRAEESQRGYESRQAMLLSNKTFATSMLKDKMTAAGKLLEELRKKGQIPNKTIPILEDRLEHTDCICGESLDAGSADGKRRRAAILSLIEESRDTDALKSKVSDLYYEGKELFDATSPRWVDEYTAAFKERDNLDRMLQDLGAQKADLEARLALVADDNVQQSREMRDKYAERIAAEILNIARHEAAIKQRKELRADTVRKFEVLSSRQSKTQRLSADLTVATDVRAVFEKSLEIMKTREVEAVSNQMNYLFLRMIGADEAEKALIRRAEITPDFRIVVYGRNDKLLDPSQDLNGASRRALTIAFVLALTEVSGVEAPNVIDTPLGMMSGYVKREVLRTASEDSSQLVLFLTHSEIAGCEDILDEKAGIVVTMTNPAHYPNILVNEPDVPDARVVMCSCNHHTECKVCARKDDVRKAPALREVA